MYKWAWHICTCVPEGGVAWGWSSSSSWLCMSFWEWMGDGIWRKGRGQDLERNWMNAANKMREKKRREESIAIHSSWFSIIASEFPQKNCYNQLKMHYCQCQSNFHLISHSDVYMYLERIFGLTEWCVFHKVSDGCHLRQRSACLLCWWLLQHKDGRMNQPSCPSFFQRDVFHWFMYIHVLYITISSLLSGMSIESMTCTICTYPQYTLMHVFAYYSKWNKMVGLETRLGWYMHNSTPSFMLTMGLKTVALSWLVLYIQGILARWIRGHSPHPKLPSFAFLCECTVQYIWYLYTYIPWMWCPHSVCQSQDEVSCVFHHSAEEVHTCTCLYIGEFYSTSQIIDRILSYKVVC